MPILMLVVILIVGMWLYRTVQKQIGDSPAAMRDMLGSLFLGLGLVLMTSPLLLNWFIHASYERYMWVIQGPPPFNRMGGGPFQLWMFFLAVMVGCGLFALGLLIRAGLNRGR